MLINNIKNLLNYKSLLINFTAKELKLKYKNSVLGFLWSFMNPLIMLAIYTFVFKYILKLQIENFELFLFTGLLCWNFFSISVNVSSNSLISQGNLIKKVYFPREVIPLSLIFSNLLNYFIMTLIIVVSSVFIVGGISHELYLYPVVLIFTFLFTTGISLFLSIATVKFRDVSYLVEVLLLVVFYMTPIVYSADLIPDRYTSFINSNPLTLMVNLHRAVLLPGTELHWVQLFTFAAISVVTFIVGYLVFKKGEMNIVEKL